MFGPLRMPRKTKWTPVYPFRSPDCPYNAYYHLKSPLAGLYGHSGDLNGYMGVHFVLQNIPRS